MSEGAGPGDQDLLSAAIGHHKAGRLPQAEAIYAQILQRQPRHADALNLLGVLRAQQARFDQARGLLETAVSEQPDNGPFRANLARVLASSGDAAAAVQAYRRALELNPRDVAAAMDLGDLLIRMDLAAEAEDCFRQVTEIAPNLAEAQEGLGAALLRQQRGDEAIAAFERATALAPNNPIGHSNLGGLLLERGRVEEAVACFRRAVALAPGDAALHTNLGVALYAAGQREAALAAYDACLKLSPSDVKALGAKGITLAELGRQSEAEAIFDYGRLLKIRKVSQVGAYASLEDFNQALAAYVSRHPSLMADRPGKTTRLGSQSAELWNDAADPIRELRNLVQAAVADYFADEALGGHPYGPARPAKFRMTAWATILNSGGHQAPHNHPAGLVSGVYYAKVPSVIGANETSEQGYLEFGRPDKRIGNKEPTMLRTIRPEEGLFVLFPSHFWHRTLPYVSDENRISIAFDLVPVEPSR